MFCVRRNCKIRTLTRNRQGGLEIEKEGWHARGLVAQTVERAHFFAQPIDVPLIDGDNALCLPRHFAAEVGDGKEWRNAPQTAEFLDTTSHG